jgi:hypothetical protein
MIFVNIPYCPKDIKEGYDLGWAYNRFMETIGQDDWAVFLDHDAMFTTSNWYRQIEATISTVHPKCALTGMTNRVGCPWQVVPGINKKNHDIRYHRNVGRICASKDKALRDMTKQSPMSGVLIILSKQAWSAGAKFESGFFGVDNSLHLAMRRIGGHIWLMPSLYVYHWYRGDGKSGHLPKNKKANTARSFR